MNHSKPDSKAPILFPEILGETVEPNSLTLALRIPEELAYFTGHFDEVSVVPGVTQILWAVYFAQRYFSISRPFSHMEAIKFKELLLPAQRLELILRHSPPPNKLEFIYRSETAEYSSGRIYFHD